MTLRDSDPAIALAGGPSWRSVVEGYVGQESYLPGDTATVHVSSAVESFDVTVSRVAARREVVWQARDVRGEFREVPADAYATGCGWPTTVTIPIGDWASGYYEVRFSWPAAAGHPDGGTYACFVVRPSRPSPEIPVLVLAAAQNAILEEVVMVGYLLTRWRQAGWSPALGIVASAVIRGAYHLYQGFGGFVGNLVMGLVFGAVYTRTRRVLPLVIAHTILDIVSFVGYALLKSHLSWL